MGTQQENILNRIENITQKQLLHGTYDFSECCAFVLAIDLSIDRSNVSRILNKLHQENLLIKLKGRPTLFISTKVLAKNFPYLSLPQTIQKDEQLSDYLFLTEKAAAPTVEAQMDMLDIRESSSLYNVAQNILPIFYYPTTDMKVFILRGERGVGRKHFLEELFENSKAKGIVQRNQKILYSVWYDKEPDLLKLLTAKETATPPFISIEIDQTISANEIAKLLNEIAFLYKNNGQAQPLVALLLSPEEEKMAHYYELTPYIGYFPCFIDRPVKERVEIVASIYWSEAKKLNREIVITKNVLQYLVSSPSKSNIAYIKREILYSISQAFFKRNLDNQNGATILVSTRHLSDKLTSDKKRVAADQRFWNQFPEKVALTPEQQTALSFLDSAQNEHWTPMSSSTQKQTLNQRINALPTALQFFSEEDYSSPLQKKLYQFLSETPLTKDPILLDFLIQTISQIVEGTAKISSYQMATEDNSFKGMSGLLRKIERYLRKTYKTIEKEQTLFIKQLIIYTIKKAVEVTVPVMISAKENQIADNLAKYFNQLLGKRLLVSMSSTRSDNMEKNEIARFVKKMSKNLKSIDRGGGSVLLTDYNPSNEIDNKILLEIRLLTFTTYPPTTAHIYDIVQIVGHSAMSVVSISSTIINKKNERKKFLESLSMNDKGERTNNEYYELLSQLFPQLNTSKTNEVLFKLLKNISDELEITPTNQLIIDFLFHGNCLLHQKINEAEQQPQTVNPSVPLKLESTVAKTIREQIDQLEDLSFLRFDDNEVLMLEYLFSYEV